MANRDHETAIENETKETGRRKLHDATVQASDAKTVILHLVGRKPTHNFKLHGPFPVVDRDVGFTGLEI